MIKVCPYPADRERLWEAKAPRPSPMVETAVAAVLQDPLRLENPWHSCVEAAGKPGDPRWVVYTCKLCFFLQFKLFPGEISAVQHRQEFRGKGLVVIDHFFSPDGLAELC